MSGKDLPGRGVAPRPAGKDAAAYSASGPKAHHELHREIAPVLSEILAAALASGALLAGGRFELRSGRLWRESAR